MTLLQPKRGSTNQANRIIPFTTTYNPYNPPVCKILKRNTQILSSSPELTDLLTYNFMVVHKRARNLKQMLTKTDVNPQYIPKGFGPCKTLCVTCPFMKPTEHVTSRTTNEQIRILGCFNCKSKNVIYVLSCTKCGLQYVGQTGNSFNERFRAHLTDIRQRNVQKPVALHYTSTDHSANNVVATIVTQTTGDLNLRLRTEETWIQRLKTRLPTGLNLKQLDAEL